MKTARVPLVLSLVAMACATTSVTSPQVRQAPEIVWVGIDYSQAQMIGTEDFADPGAIFPSFLLRWNELFVIEMLPKLGKRLGKSIVVEDGTRRRNMTATADQIVRQDLSWEDSVGMTHISREQIADAVQTYDLASTSGVALVFIVDKLVKTHDVACIYSVFFDVASRTVLETRRHVAKAGGFGFRNFWFAPIKGVVKQL